MAISFRGKAHNNICWVYFDTGPSFANPKPYLCNYVIHNHSSFTLNRAFCFSVHAFRRKMKVIAAYLLAVLGGNAAPSADDLRLILGSGTHFFPSHYYLHIYFKTCILKSHSICSCFELSMFSWSRRK